MSSESTDAPDVDQQAVAATLDAVRSALAEPRPYTLDEVAATAGVDPADLQRLFDAAGRRNDDAHYGERDVEYARDLATMLARSTVDLIERELRLRLRLLSQVVVNDLATIRLDNTVAALIEQGADPARLGEELATIATEILPAVARQLGHDYRKVMQRLLDSDVVARASADFGRHVDLAVGFVDLVGFTRLSATTEPETVGTVLGAFEDLATVAAAEVGDVLIAKTIGDAVMLVSGDVDNLVDVLLRVVEDEPPELVGIGRRAGVCWGEVIVREGDYVGTTVNHAARLTDVARPGSLVIAEDAGQHLDPERWDLSHLPVVRLKGLGTSRPYRVRRATQ